ncbi:MAG TPA: hypothetical protein DCY07_02255 [Rhodospirillaceae bacterium]|nr:hypothetical protein [Rhodospirillaceae bacterium]
MNKSLFLCLAVSLLTAMPAHAQRIQPSVQPSAPASSGMTQGIVAVVNESIITSTDLRARLGLALLSAGMPDSPEAQRRLMPQVLRTLIEEQIQLQEGKKSGITVTDDEIEKAMGRLAQENKIPGGDMAAFLRSNKISPATMKAQIRAAITWNKIVMRDVRPRIDIGEDEIDAVIGRMRAGAGKQEHLVSEIFLAVDKPEDEAEVKALADKLVEQIKGGAVFGAAARQFSQGLGASVGGDLGWIQIGQLAPEVDKALQLLNPGEVGGPIRSASGYHILGMRDRRVIALGDVKNMTVKLQQIFRPFTPETGKEALLAEAETIRRSVTDCASLTSTISNRFPQWRWQDLGEVKLAEAPAWLASKVASIPEGQGSDAMATDKGALMVFVCGRTVPEENINRDAIRAAIGSEKMELQARRLLRDLRKNAFIDVRMK